MFFNWQMDEQTIVYLYSEIQLNYKKERIVDLCNILDEC